jgi:hypothetical protein
VQDDFEESLSTAELAHANLALQDEIDRRKRAEDCSIARAGI